MAIFRSYKEADRVRTIIANRRMFDDLKENQAAIISGMYHALREIESTIDNLDEFEEEDDTVLGAIRRECGRDALEDAIASIESDIAYMYVSFCDENYLEEEE